MLLHPQGSPGKTISEFWNKMSETNMLQWFGIDQNSHNNKRSALLETFVFKNPRVGSTCNNSQENNFIHIDMLSEVID